MQSFSSANQFLDWLTNSTFRCGFEICKTSRFNDLSKDGAQIQLIPFETTVATRDRQGVSVASVPDSITCATDILYCRDLDQLSCGELFSIFNFVATANWGALAIELGSSSRDTLNDWPFCFGALSPISRETNLIVIFQEERDRILSISKTRSFDKKLIKGFVLSLARERQRRRSVIQQLGKIQFPIEIIDAIDARLLNPNFFKAFASSRLSPSEIGCYLSHIRALERICDYDLEYGVVLEDDLKIKADARLPFEGLARFLPKDLDHLQLHSYKTHFSPDYQIIERLSGFNRVSPTNVMTFGYLVSRRLAEFILQKHRHPEMPIDLLYIAISRSKQFNFYDLESGLVEVQWDLKSTMIRK